MKYVLEIKADHPQDLVGDAKAAIVARLEQVLDEEGFDNIDTVLNGQGGEITEGTIYRMSMGRVGLGPNGVILDSTKKDPVEFRGGAPEGQQIIAKFSADVISEGGHRTEVASFNLGVDGRYRDHPDFRMRKRGAIFFGVLDPMRHPELAPDHDWQWQRQMAIAHDGLWLNCPYHLPGEPGGPW